MFCFYSVLATSSHELGRIILSIVTPDFTIKNVQGRKKSPTHLRNVFGSFQCHRYKCLKEKDYRSWWVHPGGAHYETNSLVGFILGAHIMRQPSFSNEWTKGKVVEVNEVCVPGIIWELELKKKRTES